MKKKGVANSVIIIATVAITITILAGIFLKIGPKSEAEFRVSSLTISPSKVEPEEMVSISVDVTNVGRKAGSLM